MIEEIEGPYLKKEIKRLNSLLDHIVTGKAFYVGGIQVSAKINWPEGTTQDEIDSIMEIMLGRAIYV